MRRIALVLAATAFLGTGCGSDRTSNGPASTCGRSVALQWDFGNADGAVLATCGAAGVRWVDVWVNGGLDSSFDCSVYAGTVSLDAGSNFVVVEGIDFDGNTILYRDRFTIDAPSCGSQGTVATRPAEGRVNLDYSVSSAPPCANGACFLWFSVFDDEANSVAAVVNADSVPTMYPYPNDVVFQLPVGPYTVQWMDVVSGGLAERLSCTSPSFSVSPGASVGEQQVVPPSPVLLKASCP